jgi:putative PIN family toxin of toxin-antitoxin system
MKCVLDTNILVSAFLWQGLPARLIQHASKNEIQLFTSHALLAELDEVLHRKKLAKAVENTGFSADQLLSHYRRLAYRVTARQLIKRISRDPDDDHVLACALAARADLIVSGDRDLLVLKSFREIPIVTAAEALRVLGGR